MRKPKSPHPVDIYVGRRVKTRRVLRGLTQAELADQLGITFQQLQKYEKGSNRISAGRLWDVGQILDVPVPWFFEGFEGEAAATNEAVDLETLLFAQAIQGLPRNLRRQVQGVLKALANQMFADAA